MDFSVSSTTLQVREGTLSMVFERQEVTSRIEISTFVHPPAFRSNLWKSPLRCGHLLEWGKTATTMSKKLTFDVYN